MSELDQRKKHRERANRARRALLKEKSTYGFYDDGSGKRYRIGVDYLRAGETGKALEFFAWFDQEFSDDSGEPVFYLYRALANYRAGSIEKARIELQHAMLQNLYLLPELFGEPLPKQNIWHASNWHTPDYLDDLGDFLNEPTTEERAWIKQEFLSEPFTSLRTSYIETYAALLTEDDTRKRGQILDRWHRISQASLD